MVWGGMPVILLIVLTYLIGTSSQFEMYCFVDPIILAMLAFECCLISAWKAAWFGVCFAMLA